MPNPPPVVVVDKKRRWGCWGCGCGLLLIVAVAIGAFFVFMGRTLYSVARAATSEQGIAIQTTDGGDAVLAAAQQKVNAFHEAVEHNQPGSLHLTSDEINTLIARDPEYAQVRGHLHVDLKDNTASVQTSFLLGQFEKFVLADRYFNGTITFTLGFDPATHQVTTDLQQLMIGNNPMPPEQISSLNTSLPQIINQKIQENPDARNFVNHASKIAIENSELVIETK